MKGFHDLSQEGAVSVREYESSANNLAVLLSFGREGPSLKVAPEQAKDLLSALLRIYEFVQA